jgi:uncharacterized membrane protein
MNPSNTFEPPTPVSAISDSGASSRNIRAVSALEHSALAQRSMGERWADRVAATAGRVWFAMVHVGLFLGWMILNSGILSPALVFDPYPFQLLTLVTSLEAIFLSLFILTSQNRATSQADQRSHLDLQINLLAEAESTAALKILQALCIPRSQLRARRRDHRSAAAHGTREACPGTSDRIARNAVSLPSVNSDAPSP